MALDSSSYEKVAKIINDAGGKLVGRTRLQKIAYLLDAAGLEDGFHFEYHYYGPYSETLSKATLGARALGYITEKEQPTSWGGTYSVYSADRPYAETQNPVRRKLVEKAAQADAIDLELAATAAYLKIQGDKDPWATTERLKADKAANGHLEQAKTLYRELRSIVATLPELL